MNPLGLLVTLALSAVIISGDRRKAAVAILLGVCYITQGQTINVVVFNFTAIRILLLVGFVRLLTRGEYAQLATSPLDRAMLLYAISICVMSVVRMRTSTELVYQLGILYNVLLSYYVFRGLIRDHEDVKSVFITTAILLVPVGLLMMLEARVGRSVFTVFGGITDPSVVREGKVRCAGAFRQAITAGSFGAIFALYYIGHLFSKSERRLVAIIGLAASLAILITAHSSGPLLGFGLGVVAYLIWPFRQSMGAVRVTMVLLLIGLHLVMKQPVWFLLARIGDLIGGGGYHRSYLLDRFIVDIDRWWLLGSIETADWFPYTLYTGLADITNQWVSDGLNGGIIGLFFAIALNVTAYKTIGTAIAAARVSHPERERLLWGVGATYTGGLGILVSVTYFDQMHVAWYFIYACIAAVTKIEFESPTSPTNDPALVPLHKEA